MQDYFFLFGINNVNDYAKAQINTKKGHLVTKRQHLLPGR